MILAQFGSRAAQGWRPAWLGGMVEQQNETGAAAKSAPIDAPWADFAVDGYGAWRAPLDFSNMSVSGRLYCNEQMTANEWQRAVRAHVGEKDWLIGYRGAGCKCGACGPYARCCNVCGYEQEVQWMAMRARLNNVVVQDSPGAQAMISSTVPVELGFEPHSAWQHMSDDRWAWGKPGPLATVPSDTCDPPAVTEMAWPCQFPSCATVPPFRFYRREKTWIQNYCVGYWSAGRWIRSSVANAESIASTDSEAIIQVAGDTYPMSRLGFTNFSELTVTVCSPTGFTYSFTVGDRYNADKWVGEPQYLLISPWAPPQVRFCPIHDDECLDLVPASYVALAQEGAVVPVESQTVPVLGYLWPGRNILRFTGFRLPGHPFHYSYDIIPCFL